MRLLNARTLALKTFVDDIPPYAILSHCWEDDEVVISDLSDLEYAKTKKGFWKIEKTCGEAIKDGLDYVWVDTCCIDKSSSAELSEAINSMFAWYKNSDKCYAYLADVKYPGAFARSRWFTRAWTLQELLAPSSFQSKERAGMEFFSSDWHLLGDKASESKIISDVTGVPKEYLEGKSLDAASISMRMSWAADRQATRAEDIAYSLLGIFDVNMPLLYGEGKLKAFRRLQEEIMKISEDETLFAWESVEFTTDASTLDELASDPKDFSEARDLVPFASEDRVVPYTMTHRGLRIWLRLIAPTTIGDWHEKIRPLRSPIMIWSSYKPIWAILRCHVAHDFHHVVIIPLRHLSADIYLRDTSTNVALLPTETQFDAMTTEEVYIRNSRIPSIASSVRRRFGFLIRNLPDGFSVASATPRESWDPKDQILQGYRQDSGNHSWHASLNLGSNLTFHPAKHMLFLSLGCKPSQGAKQPIPWCHLDDTIFFHGQGSLEAFHNSVTSKPHRHSVDKFRHNKVTRDIKITVQITSMKVFGQDMFVVDINHVRDNSLGLPDSSLRVKTASPAVLSRDIVPSNPSD